jgi:hypothetical protein
MSNFKKLVSPSMSHPRVEHQKFRKKAHPNFEKCCLLYCPNLDKEVRQTLKMLHSNGT